MIENMLQKKSKFIGAGTAKWKRRTNELTTYRK